MGLMSIIVATLNEQEKENGGTGNEWVDLHTKPVELVETPHGIIHRDVETGRFTKE